MGSPGCPRGDVPMIRSTRIFAALVAGSLAAGSDSIQAIDDSYQAAVRQLSAPRSAAEEKTASAEFQAVLATLVDRAVVLAANHPGSPAAVAAWTWIIQYDRAGSEPKARALETLRRDAITSDRLGEACAWAANTAGKESLEAERFLRAALDQSPHPPVRGRACFGLAELLESRADEFRDVAKLPRSCRDRLGDVAFQRLTARPADDLCGEAGALYDRVAQSSPNLEHSRTGKPLGTVAEGRAYRLRHLAVGRAVPEIEGVDVAGKPLKLSDHRGEVIVLTFSGIWCPSCHHLYPQQRDLLKRYQGRPFAVLSVDTDEDKAPLRQAIAAGEVAWPCWWDGGVGGPITLRRGIDSFPTVFVIDRKGTVRFKDIQGPQLDEVVETLLNES